MSTLFILSSPFSVEFPECWYLEIEDGTVLQSCQSTGYFKSYLNGKEGHPIEWCHERCFGGGAASKRDLTLGTMFPISLRIYSREVTPYSFMTPCPLHLPNPSKAILTLSAKSLADTARIQKEIWSNAIAPMSDPENEFCRQYLGGEFIGDEAFFRRNDALAVYPSSNRYGVGVIVFDERIDEETWNVTAHFLNPLPEGLRQIPVETRAQGRHNLTTATFRTELGALTIL